VPTNDEAFPKELLSAVGNSGFPFQTAIAAAIRASGIFTIEEEVAWQDSDGVNKFLDIVATNERVRLCIECKALRSETLVFLLPHVVQRAGTFEIHAVHLSRMTDSTRRPIVVYGTSQTAPLTPESNYCVAAGKKAHGESRLIEREVQPLVQGTEEYARDRCQQFRPPDNKPQSVICIPVLITTAKLFVAIYDPLSIPLENGIYQAQEKDLRPVPFIRFTKEFTASSSEGSRLRSVIIAQAVHLKDLVTNLCAAQVSIVPDRCVAVFDSINGRSDKIR